MATSGHRGHNLDALRAPRPGFAGKVRCLATDPPYNTGNRDFLYNDRFLDKDDLWRHSKWLEFMARRLTLARDLLAEDGAAFIHIDDNEVFNLGLLMNKVFGESNFIANCIWQKVFVTTWQTVATRVTDKRNVRRDSEQHDSIDAMVLKLRKQGLRIGVVVDEAHHSFHGETLAARFFREVLAPEYTILITATPDDADILDFQKRLGVAELRRTSIARQDAVDAGLIKDGVRCAAYFVDADKARMVDLEPVALRDAVTTHRHIKARLAADGVDLAPLLLVQVDSTPKSTDKAVLREEFLDEANDPVAVARMLDTLLALHPEMLYEAQRLALAKAL
ncbi:MAG: DNA methyltransferase [Verrucomicrobia bacterium]|nr:DNA methyltransferase [Verrucomicrobiota bacterium]